MLTYAHITISVLLIVAILLQQKGGGLSSTFGGSAMEYSTKRGAEKIIFYTAVILTILFFSISVARLLI